MDCDEILETITETEEHDDIEKLESAIRSIDDTEQITGVRCAAHTLQLAVTDTLKDTAVSSIVAKARHVVKKLRAPNLQNMLKRFDFKKPKIDVPTRWNSTLDMLESIICVKSFCLDMTSTNQDLYLNDGTWAKIENITEALRPAKKFTLLLQREQLIMGDVLGGWLQCLIETEKIQTRFANSLSINIKKRQKEILETPLFLGAILLDPRYKIILTAEQISTAKTKLQQIWVKFQKLNQEVVENSSSSASDEEDELEILLKQKESDRKIEKKSYGGNIATAIEEFINEPRLKKTDDILSFWNSRKTHPLYPLAMIVLATPATQVSVERLFSGLKYIMSSQRSTLSSSMLEKIILIRSFEIFNK